MLRFTEVVKDIVYQGSDLQNLREEQTKIPELEEALKAQHVMETQ